VVSHAVTTARLSAAMMKTVKAANSGQTKRSHRAKGTRPIPGHLRHPPALSGNDPDHRSKTRREPGRKNLVQPGKPRFCRCLADTGGGAGTKARSGVIGMASHLLLAAHHRTVGKDCAMTHTANDPGPP